MSRIPSVLAICALLASTAGAEAARPLRFGVQIAPEAMSIDDVVATAKLVENLGYDHFWLNDHFLPYRADADLPHFESWTILAALARETKKIRLGILVTGNTYRHPAVLAKMATTVDHLSGGRLELGLGAGWQENEHVAYGIPFYSAKERAERLGEALEVVKRLWTENHPTMKGKYYSLEKAPFSPRNVQQPHPPIVVGGQGRKWIMPLVARYADEWTVAVGVDPEGMKERLEGIRNECRKIERSPCVREVSVFLPLANMSSIPLAGPVTRLGASVLYDPKLAASVLAGSPESIRSRIQEYADAGATSVITTTRPKLDHELLRRFAKEVVEPMRAARDTRGSRRGSLN